MEAIKEIFFQINSFLVALHINAMYVMLWVAAGYIQSTYFKTAKFTDAWKTLFLGSLFSVVYAILLRDAGKKETWVEFCASYIFATSLYELFIKSLANKILFFFKKWYLKMLGDNDK